VRAAAEQLVDRHGLRLALHAHAVDLAADELVADLRAGILRDEDLRTVDGVHALEPRGQIHVVADRRVAEPLRRAGVANDGLAGVDADADVDLGPAARRPARA